ncbi:sensor histidine kinase [Paenibacillus sp. P96]|uniref:histidine kinase n=1 Tax=Paenibacillus zeirhizosphaerae TaxID=2987519 RepID=A0ABT9FU85_9BACL|nr:sensor histidine kinase [Paenibacillus sp. P96]MDP4098303.1 sensor histidine kinase [Paenibacillus sp. P96]
MLAHRIKNAFIHAGIHRKMLLLISMLMLASFIIFAAVLGYVFRIYDEQMYLKTSEVLNMSSIGIENQLKDMEQLTFKVVSDEQLQEYLRRLESETSPYAKLVLRKKITNRLIAFAGSEKYVYSMMLIDNQHHVMAAGNREGIPEKLRSDLVRLAEGKSGSIAWYAGGQSSLLASRQLKSFSDASFSLKGLGTLVVRVRIDRIVNDRVRDEDSGQLMITDGTQFIYPERPMLNPAELRSELDRKQPYGIATYAGGTYFTAQARSSYTGWTYLHTTPFDEMFRSISLIKQLVTVIFVLLLLIALALGARLSGSITRPIHQLISQMRNIEKGDLDKLEEEALGLTPPSSHSEVRLLHRTYRKMIRRIRELINENYAKQLLLRETELKALQAQINPHFLYNTLESVNWLAKVNKQHKISEMVEALGFLLRSAASFREQLIPLEKELDIVRSYVTIQTTRFEERLLFSLDVEEGLDEALIPKLTLQPLVENAIHYALEPNINPCTITITVRQVNGMLLVRVQDDGPGMSEAFLARLRSGQIRTRGQGIGLSNIQERIKLTFGPQWGLELDSRPDEGTAVTIRIPLIKGGERHVQSAVG